MTTTHTATAYIATATLAATATTSFNNDNEFFFFNFQHCTAKKYHNNLLQPVVISSLNHVCFAPGYDFDGRSYHFDS